MTARRGLLCLLAAGLAAAAARPADAQLLHRPRCSSVGCADSLFRLELQRVTLTEGPLASDRDAADLRFLRRRIQRELTARPDDPMLLLALAETALGAGDPLSALSAGTRALEAGADSALAMRVQGEARMRVVGGAADGAALYLAAVARMTRTAAPRFLADLMPILTPTELDWWRSSEIDRLRDWTRDYWEHRAALAGVTVEERLAEHMRRKAVAAQRYDPPGSGSGAVPENGLLRVQEHRLLPYDERGLVYIRRGEPLEVRRTPASISSELPPITWVYAGIDGSLDSFHFTKTMMSGSSYRAVLVPGCGSGDVGHTVSHGVETDGGWVLWNAPTEAQARSAAAGCFARDMFTQRARGGMNRIALRRSALRALEAESPRPPFAVGLPAFFDFYGFRGANGATEIVTPVVVPVSSGGARTVDVLVTFADETGGVVRRASARGSVRTEVVPTVFSADEHWGVAYVRTTVQPTERAAFRLVVRDPAAPERGSTWGGAISIRSYAGGGPSMSDVVVTGSGPATWSRGSTRLFLLPARDFLPGSSVALFYELYGFTRGSTYRTELTLRPADESLTSRLSQMLTGPDHVRLRFDAEIPEDAADVQQELRSLTLPPEPGRYRLTVRVTDASGAIVEATREITISLDAAAPIAAALASDSIPTRTTETD